MRIEEIPEALIPGMSSVYSCGFHVAEQGKRVRKGCQGFFKGQGRGGVISWLLSSKNSGGQAIGLAGVTGLKEHTILKALGFTEYIRVQGYNISPFFCLKEERRIFGYSGYKL